MYRPSHPRENEPLNSIPPLPRHNRPCLDAPSSLFANMLHRFPSVALARTPSISRGFFGVSSAKKPVKACSTMVSTAKVFYPARKASIVFPIV